ncbi:MAG: hypothetical protein EOM08_01940 [Clostridia bacterium]|nr:hypothetical protein [Clostridia bacterium]
MYQLLSSESKLKIAEADFTERYAKIMQGIEASELGFEMAADGLARPDDQASATVTFSVQMDTLAGQLDLTGYTMNLVQETTDGEILARKTRGASHYVVPLVKKAMDEVLAED